MVTFPVTLDIFIRDDSGDVVHVERIALTTPDTYSIGRSPDSDVQLDAPEVSGKHAYLVADRAGLAIEDRSSTNGTFIGEREVIGRTSWSGASRIRIGPYEIALVDEIGVVEPRLPRSEVSVTVNFTPTGQSPEPAFPYSIFKTAIVDVGTLKSSGHFHKEFEYLALGGGLGSFTWVDHLRIFGVPARSIGVVGSYEWNPDSSRDYPRPYGNYRRLCTNSQIPGYERLRSNSISTPDNIWGFPGYASRETWRSLKRLRIGGLRHIMQVFGEPALAQSYTPKSDDVFTSIDREAARIGWAGCCLNGRVLALRKTNDGRYAVALRMEERHAAGGHRDRIVVGKFVHIATGYPAYRTEQDVFDFNTQHVNENRVFKAYDSHEQVYKDLEQRRQPATVAVRGRGIVASRILQRLAAARAQNDQIEIIHQMRTSVTGGNTAVYGRARRAVFNNTELQPFNWPKSCWGGELRGEIDGASPEQRSKIIARIGGTTTAARADWKRIVEDGIRQGWYRVAIGRLQVKGLSEAGPRKILMEYSGPDSTLPREIKVDYVIDCIGLIGDVTNSEFLRDIVQTYNIPRNRDYSQKEIVYRGIAVSPDFEVVGLRQKNGGRVYAGGQITIHGPHAAVDSFLGLQYAALRSVDNLHEIGAPHVSRFGMMKSFFQWLRWCFNRAP